MFHSSRRGGKNNAQHDKITKDTDARIAISKESNIGKAYKTHREKKQVSSKTKNDTD